MNGKSKFWHGKQKQVLKKIIGEHLCDLAVGTDYTQSIKAHKVEDIHNTQILISDKETIFRLYNALLLIKDKDSQANRKKMGERARHVRQDTQMANKLMKRRSTF